MKIYIVNDIKEFSFSLFSYLTLEAMINGLEKVGRAVTPDTISRRDAVYSGIAVVGVALISAYEHRKGIRDSC